MESEVRESLADVMREIVGNRTQRDVADVIGISHAYLNDWLQGRNPSRRLAQQAADRLGLRGAIRRRFFAATGYVDNSPDPPPSVHQLPGELEYEPVLDEIDVSGLRGAEGLYPEDIEEANHLLREFLRMKRQRRGLE